MNKENKQAIESLNEQLSFCSNELSTLLDLIYKFPQQQREKYYDRIQLFKQNLTQLKICLKDAQVIGSVSSLEKKYQQVYMKVMELKGEIGHIDMSQNRKRRNTLNDMSSIIAEQGNKGKSTGLKNQYETAMEIIVDKEEQVKKLTVDIERCKEQIENMEIRENQHEEEVLNLNRDLKNIRLEYAETRNKNISLEKELDALNEKYSALERSYIGHKESSDVFELEIKKLTNLLEENMSNSKMYKSQVESTSFQLLAMEEKYKYDLKEFAEKVEILRMKEKGYEKRIKQLEGELETTMTSETLNQNIKIENFRLKEDLKVLEAELLVKEEHLYEKNKKIEIHKGDANIYKNHNEEIIREIESKSAQIERLIQKEKENTNIILSLEDQVHSLEHSLTHVSEEKLMYERKLRECERKLNDYQKECESLIEELKLRLTIKEEELRKMALYSRENEQNSNHVNAERQKIQREFGEVSLEYGKAEKRVEEISKIMIKVEEEKNSLIKKVMAMEEEKEKKEELLARDSKEIESLKKRLLRSKIESIHDIRKAIL